MGCYDNLDSERTANPILPFRWSWTMPTVNELYKAHEQLKRDGKNEEAIAKLEELLQQDDTHVLSHLAQAVLYGKVEKHDQAVTHAEKAVELEPQDTFNWTALSTTYQRAFEATRDRQYIFRAEDAKARAAQMQWQR
jgi:Tfp pilus assembly protein PilF